MSEKITDYGIMRLVEDITGVKYETSHDKTLFGQYIPDGRLKLNDDYLIIENKVSIEQEKEAKEQLILYCNQDVKNKFKNLYCLFGYQENKRDKNVGYKLFKFDSMEIF